MLVMILGDYEDAVPTLVIARPGAALRALVLMVRALFNDHVRNGVVYRVEGREVVVTRAAGATTSVAPHEQNGSVIKGNSPFGVVVPVVNSLVDLLDVDDAPSEQEFTKAIFTGHAFDGISSTGDVDGHGDNIQEGEKSVKGNLWFGSHARGT